ncbi:MAG: pyruvate formate lyase family protein [Christensenellales bacterium]|jgi:pyruvate-formate lyase
MRERINQLPPDAPMGYRERMAILRERKIEDTRDKAGYRPFMDGDDYGAIMPPEDFHFEPIPNHANGSWYGYEGWSRNFHKLMTQHPVFIDPCDAFPNRWMTCMSWLKQGAGFNPDYPYDDLKPFHIKYGIVHGIGADAHFGGDYTIGLKLGWGGLLLKLAEHRIKNPGKDAFYDAEERAILGIQNWLRRTVAAIDEALTVETHPMLLDNLAQMRRDTAFLIEHAPVTLRQACQWLCIFNMASRTYNRDGAGGQLDEVLRPYWERDRAQGILEEEEAIFYIACLLLNDAHYYQLGGMDAEGNDLVSPISYLILEAASWLNASCNITVRVHDNMDPDFLTKSVEYLFRHQKGWPRFSGDQALSEGFMRKGFSRELAVQRVAVGCHWMSLPGLEYTLNDCVKTNNARIFQVALDDMMQQGGVFSTERLYRLFDQHTRIAVDATGRGIRFHLKHQVFNEPELMLNLISVGPVEKGLDIVEGGAMYYNMGIDGTGIATVADSFAALEQRIEQEKRLTWEEVYALLQADFAGPHGEYVRRMLSASNRYGGGNTRADWWAQRLSKDFSDAVVALDGDGVKFIPGWFSWSNTIQLGSAVGATPNGRHAGEPINHGANPHPGFRRDGALTAMSNAICAIQPGYGNPAPIQLELDPGMAATPEAIGKLTAYIRTICDLGATLLNINIINADDILKADENPALYPDLVVRVTGFTAYFCLLTPEFRKLVVDRILTAS